MSTLGQQLSRNASFDAQAMRAMRWGFLCWLRSASPGSCFKSRIRGKVNMLAAALLALTVCAEGIAQGRWQPPEEFLHTEFTTEQGAPGAVHAMEQTTDGFLWLGTETGLVRFDGVRFERFESPRFPALPFSNVSALLATPDGGLWIGYRTGGASFLRGRTLTSYGEKEGMPSAQTFQFVVDADGVLWAATSRGLRRMNSGRWESIGQNWGLDDVPPGTLMVDDDGGLWAGGRNWYVLAPHSRGFVKAGESTQDNPSWMQAEDGSVWAAPGRRGALAYLIKPSAERAVGSGLAVTTHPRRARGCHATGMLCAASDGSIWAESDDGGVVRVSSAEQLLPGRGRARDAVSQMLPGRGEGTRSGLMINFLEDKEGNMWVGTRKGIHRFRRRNVYRAPFPVGVAEADLSLVAGDDGAVWAGVEGEPLMEVRNGAVSTIGVHRHVVCMYRDHAGDLWIGAASTLTKLSKTGFQEIGVPTGLRPGERWKVRAITQDGSADIWVSIVQNGVFRLKDKVWSQYGGLAALPQLTALTLTTDGEGRVWFGYTENRIARFDGKAVRTFSTAQGLDVGNVTAVAARTGRIWVGGQYGLARFTGDRFQMLTTQADGDLRGISGIIETSNGDLWLNQTSGLAHLTASEIAAKLGDPLHKLQYELFDNRDGLRGTATQFNFLPTLALATDGRIWISGTEGASWIDPSHIYRNPVPPPVSVQLLTVDGLTYTSPNKIVLPPLPSSVQIDYTALSLSIPERVRFRYKLQGIDKDWQDAGARRSAFYTKLGPGSYQFSIMASNNDGVWNESPDIWSFTVAPAFYQTIWFRALCVALAAGALWMFYLYHVHRATAHVRERLGVRLEERERIARELHDTLLQGFQGLVLRFQGVMKLLPEQGPPRQMMESVLDRADQVLLEGRERVWDLRLQGMDGGELPESLARTGEDLAVEHGMPFSLTVVGSPLPLDPTVCGEAYRVGNEALRNAFRHSEGTKVEAELTYDHAVVRLAVRDDGRGIDGGILGSGRAGHWGLFGMRERAERIGAQLHIWSHVGAGTEVELTIPRSVAFRGSRRIPAWARRGSST